jgi:hypothetical protein
MPELYILPAGQKPELTIHYQRPGFEIIGPDEVENRQEKIGVGVYKISPTIAVKHGYVKPKLREAWNMLFIEQNTTIPIPKVHAVYTYPTEGKLWWQPGETVTHYDKVYIFMDLVPGLTAEHAWETWDEATVLNVQNELKEYIRQLRALPGGDYIGTLNHGPVTDCMLRYDTDDLGEMRGSSSPLFQSITLANS